MRCYGIIARFCLKGSGDLIQSASAWNRKFFQFQTHFLVVMITIVGKPNQVATRITFKFVIPKHCFISIFKAELNATNNFFENHENPIKSQRVSRSNSLFKTLFSFRYLKQSWERNPNNTFFENHEKPNQVATRQIRYQIRDFKTLFLFQYLKQSWERKVKNIFFESHDSREKYIASHIKDMSAVETR